MLPEHNVEQDYGRFNLPGAVGLQPVEATEEPRFLIPDKGNSGFPCSNEAGIRGRNKPVT